MINEITNTSNTGKNLALESKTSATLAGLAAKERIGQTAFESWRNMRAKQSITVFEVALRHFAIWLNVAFDAHNDKARVSNLSTSGNDWQYVESSLVEIYKEALLKAGYAIATVNSRLTAIRTGARLALQSGSISAETQMRIAAIKNITQRERGRINEKRAITRLGSKKVVATPITEKQAHMLVNNQPDTIQGLRDSLIMALLLNHGVRVSELPGLTRMVTGDGIITIFQPKTQQTIKHKLSRETLPIFQKYLALTTGNHDSPLLRSSKKGGKLLDTRMGKGSIQIRVRLLGGNIGIYALSPHDCRHYAATKLSKTHNTRELMDIFGWKSPAMAMRYIKSAEFSTID